MKNDDIYRTWLKQTEAQARKFGAEAISHGDYDTAERVLRVGSIVASLISGSKDSTSADVRRGNAEAATSPNSLRSQSSDQIAVLPHRENPEVVAEASGASYRRDGDRLIKVASLRGGRGLYEHRVGYAVLREVVKRISDLALASKPFGVDDIQSAIAARSEIPVPSYQLYVCVGWLKDRQLIEQRGRQGYRVDSPKKLLGRVEQEWININKHSSGESK